MPLAATHALDRRPGTPATGVPAAARRLTADVIGPALLVSLALAMLVAAGLTTFGGNATGFVRFGQNFAAVIHPPHGAIVYSQAGYDGQYFWSLATDPLLLHHQTLTAFAAQAFRLQRIAYPALAFVLAGGRAAAVPWTLLLINVIVVLGATIAFSLYARRRGWSGWWALGLGLLPGFGFAVLADLSDVLAVTTMLGGMIAWGEGRRRPAAVLLTVAVLAREPMMLAVVAIGLQELLAARPSGPGLLARVRAAWSTAWPAVFPVAAFAIWQAYVHVRIGRSTSAPGTAFSAPFAAIVTEVGHALANSSPVNGGWDLIYLASMLGGLGVAIALVRRERSAPAIAAVLFGVMLLVLTFGYAWSYARLSAPMFACLLLCGLQRRHRGALGICAVVAGLGSLVPLAIG